MAAVGADEGLLIYAFRDGYGPDRIRAIMGNQAQAAIVLGVVLLGEQKVWEGAQKDIMAIADKAADSFRPGGAGGDSIDLKVGNSRGPADAHDTAPDRHPRTSHRLSSLHDARVRRPAWS